MSEWIEANVEDIRIDDNKVNVFVKQNDFGAVYVQLNVSDVLAEIWKAIQREGIYKDTLKRITLDTPDGKETIDAVYAKKALKEAEEL